MFINRALLAIILVALPARAWAGAIEVRCEAPFVFSGAAVNVVVLPYSLPASFGGKTSKAGEQLGGLVQLETILAIAKFGSIGVVQLVGDTTRDCTPEIVLNKLTGKQSGAVERMKPGAGLILIWGRIFQSGTDLFLQSYIRFLRPGANETIDLTVRGRTLTSPLSTQAFACAPRKIAIRDIDDIQRQFSSARLLYAEPNTTAAAMKLPEGLGPIMYWITDVRGDWVRVQPRHREGEGGPRLPPGWMQARSADAQWSLRRQMPELYFVEGVTGYLMARVRSSAPAVVESALQNADAALGRYLDAWGANAVLGTDAADGGTPLAVAVPRQLRGFVALLRGRGSDAAVSEASPQFERAAMLAPHSANARNLVTMMRVAQAYRQPSADQSPRRFIDEVRGMLGIDPENVALLTNLDAIYDLVLTAAPGAPPSWTLSATDREQLIKQRQSLQALLKRPVT
jgi:hypothetical protein